jgi:hypothetical protein
MNGNLDLFLSCSTDLRIRTFHCLQTIVGHLQTNNGFDDRSKEKKENADNHPRRIVAEKRFMLELRLNPSCFSFSFLFSMGQSLNALEDFFANQRIVPNNPRQ